MQAQVNGIRVNYELAGKANAPVVVLSHSLGSSLYMWDPQIQALQAHYQVLRYDTRGHGGSEVSQEAYTLDQLADDAIALLDELGIAKAHWLGLSMGGMIGQSLMLRYPERLLSAILCDTMAVLPEGAQSMWQARINTAREQGLSALVDATMQRWFSDAYLAQDALGVKLIRQYFLATPTQGFIACCEAIMGLNYLSRLHAVKMPVLIVVGEQDSGTPVAASQAIHEQIDRSQLVILPSASHMSNVEQPQAFTESVLTFLAANS